MADIVEHADVRMIESGNRLRFAVETGFHLRVVGEMRRKNFDCNCAIQPSVACFIDFTHAPGADGGKDFVWAELCADGETHVCSGLERELDRTFIYEAEGGGKEYR